MYVLEQPQSPLLESFVFEDAVLQETVDCLILGEFSPEATMRDQAIEISA